jgi:membrane protease YdiL (CAAX protease family)
MKSLQHFQPLKKFEKFAVRHPILFGFILIILFSILGTLTWPITQIYPYPEGSGFGEALAKIIISSFFIGLLWRFGWLEFAGYRNPGMKRIWLMVIPLILYKVILDVFAFTGKFTFPFPSFAYSLGIIFFTFTTALLEESMYRGLLLTAMRKAWGGRHRGVILSALLSGFFFASTHLFNLLIRPFPVVLAQVLSLTLSGFYYAVFVIYGRSIWPAVLFHWATNATVNLALQNIPGFSETLEHWVIYTLVSLIPIFVSLWLIQQGGEENENHRERSPQPIESIS